MIMEGLETMLSDAVSISALLAYDNKMTKFCLLKKQMSNISTPSPSGSPGPLEVASSPVLDTSSPVLDTSSPVLDTAAIGASILGRLQQGAGQQHGQEQEVSPVELSEFFPPSSCPSPLPPVTAPLDPAPLTTLTPSGESHVVSLLLHPRIVLNSNRLLGLTSSPNLKTSEHIKLANRLVRLGSSESSHVNALLPVSAQSKIDLLLLFMQQVSNY